MAPRFQRIPGTILILTLPVPYFQPLRGNQLQAPEPVSLCRGCGHWRGLTLGWPWMVTQRSAPCPTPHPPQLSGKAVLLCLPAGASSFPSGRVGWGRGISRLQQPKPRPPCSPQSASKTAVPRGKQEPVPQHLGSEWREWVGLVTSQRDDRKGLGGRAGWEHRASNSIFSLYPEHLRRWRLMAHLPSWGSLEG